MALQLNPRNAKAAGLLGEIYARQGQNAKAKQVFETLAKALPQDAVSRYRLGLLARAEKNDSAAISYFEEALKINPNAIEPLSQIVDIKLEQHKPAEARERALHQLELSPNNPMIHNVLGGLYVIAKQSDKAEAEFKKAIELNNAILTSYMNLAQLYHHTGKVDQAVKEYEAILAKNPKVLQAHMLLGIIYQRQNQYDKSKAAYEQVLALNPKFAPAANNLAWMLMERGENMDQALSYAQTAREQSSDDPHIADTLGWIYYQKNVYLKAVSLLKEAAEKLPSDPIVQYHYGMAQHKNGNPAAAKKILAASLKLNSNYPGADEARKVLSEQ
jgi:tetratricopeptide (TPR) repeat protein